MKAVTASDGVFEPHALIDPDAAPSAAFADGTYRFCSDHCRARFELAPERYVGNHVGRR